eukprot:7084045-Lingulodinium_polyedra.AAC.1
MPRSTRTCRGPCRRPTACTPSARAKWDGAGAGPRCRHQAWAGGGPRASLRARRRPARPRPGPPRAAQGARRATGRSPPHTARRAPGACGGPSCAGARGCGAPSTAHTAGRRGAHQAPPSTLRRGAPRAAAAIAPASELPGGAAPQRAPLGGPPATFGSPPGCGRLPRPGAPPADREPTPGREDRLRGSTCKDGRHRLPGRLGPRRATPGRAASARPRPRAGRPPQPRRLRPPPRRGPPIAPR